MTWVKFTADYDYKPRASVTIPYGSGRIYRVRKECAERAIAAGKAVEVDSPSKKEEPDGRS